MHHCETHVTTRHVSAIEETICRDHRNRGKNGHEVATKWEQEPQSGARMGTRWEEEPTNGNKKPKVVKKWEQSGTK